MSAFTSMCHTGAKVSLRLLLVNDRLHWRSVDWRTVELGMWRALTPVGMRSLRETKVFGFRGKYGCRPPGELKTERPLQPHAFAASVWFRATIEQTRYSLATCLSQWHGWTAAFMSGRTYCDDDVAGLLSPSRQPSITDASRGGRDSLLVEAICWLDDVAPSCNQSAWTPPALRIAHHDLTKGSNRTLFWFPNLRILWFPRSDCANRGEDRSFHVTEGSVPVWTIGLVPYPTFSWWGLQVTVHLSKDTAKRTGDGRWSSVGELLLELRDAILVSHVTP